MKLLDKFLKKLGYVKCPSYEEALNQLRELHKEKFGHRTVTPGEFFGFRRTYTLLTGKEAPPYTGIG